MNDNKVQKMRSPKYPSIDLPKALELTSMFYEKQKKNKIAAEVAIESMGYKGSGSAGRQTLAALTYFGLVESEGQGPARRVRISELAFRILMDQRPDSKERAEAIKEAALNPKVHKKVFDSYSSELPPDDALKYDLTVDMNFNPNAVDDLLRELRRTFEFAKIYESSILEDNNDDGDEELNEDTEEANPNGASSPSPKDEDNQAGAKGTGVESGGDNMNTATYNEPKGMFKVTDKRIGDGFVHIYVEGEWTQERIDRLCAFLEFDKEDWPNKNSKDE